MRRTACAIALGLLASAAYPAGALPLPGSPDCPMFPRSSVFHADIRGLPVHPKNKAWKRATAAKTTNLHPDFGRSGDPGRPWGIPYEVVDGDHEKVSIDFLYADESDAGPYPFDDETPIERGSDRHALMVDRDTCTLYELYDARYDPDGSTAGSGAIWNLRRNRLRPDGWTSADAAGLPILPLLVRYDEVAAGRVNHMIRMTASVTDRRYLWPARHQAGARRDRSLPPMGAVFRLKKSFDRSGFRDDTKVVLKAMRKHGMILADNGSNWYFTGAASNDWPDAMLDELKTVPASAFVAVDISSLRAKPNSARVADA